MSEGSRQPKLHLDADTSGKALHQALVARGHDVTRTPNDWMPLDTDDEAQLLGATAQGRVIFTFNIRDFVELSQRYTEHAGIVLAAQRRWQLPMLIEALEPMMNGTTSEEWIGQVRWLSQWR